MTYYKKKTHKLLQNCYDEIAEDCLRKCEKYLNIEYNIAKKFLYRSSEKRFLLPFVGVVYEERCKAVKYANGLHLQCRKLYIDGNDYCEKHSEEASKSLINKPLIGDIRDRLKCPLLEYIDLKNRRTKPYIYVVLAKKMNKEECLYEAKKQNIIIPDIHWKERISKRGRPKMKHIIAVSDTDDDNNNIFIKNMRDALPDSDSDDGYIILFETEEGYVDERLGIVYSKDTGKMIRLLKE